MSTPRRDPGSLRGFSLIELLVVVGVIAVLLSLLLTATSAARRQADQLKCLASLKEIGNGFKLYAHDFKGAWPVAVHQQGPYTPAVPLLPEERRWYDLLARYVTGTKHINSANDIATIRRNSVIWGCPAWTKTSEYDPNSSFDNLRVGYGMQYHPMIDSSTSLRNFAYIGANGFVGHYVKSWDWNARGSERGVIGCATTHAVAAASTFSRSSSEWAPFPPTDPAQPQLLFDSTRHLKGGTSKKASAKHKGLNMLFADGHATPVSIVEAWNAIRYPGQDRSTP